MTYAVDEEIILMLWDDDPTAKDAGLAKLFELYGDDAARVLYVSYGTRLNEFDIEGILYEALMNVNDKADTFNEGSSLRPWFIKIAVNLARMELRKRGRVKQITTTQLSEEMEAVLVNHAEEASEKIAASSRAMKEVNKIILNDLSDLQRRIILADLSGEEEGVTNKKLAPEWNVPASSIRTERIRAHDRIKGILSKHGYTELK